MAKIERIINKKGELWTWSEFDRNHHYISVYHPLLRYQSHQHELAITSNGQLFHLSSYKLIDIHNVKQVITNNLEVPNYTHIVLLTDGQLLFIQVSNDGELTKSIKTLDNVKWILPSKFYESHRSIELGILIDKWMYVSSTILTNQRTSIFSMIRGIFTDIHPINETYLQPISTNSDLDILDIQGDVAITSNGNYQLVDGQFVTDNFRDDGGWTRLRIDDNNYMIDGNGNTYSYTGYHLELTDLPSTIVKGS